MNSTARAIGALLALSASTFIFVTTETLPIGLLTLISADLSKSPSAIGLLVTGYGLVVVVASIPLTQLTRRVPRRLLLSSLLAMFVAASVLSAAASGYAVLLGARVVTALSQALFWAVVVPTATSLFRPEVHGRVVAVVFGGSSLAAVLGVPAGTWLGQQAGWRASFLALAAVAVLALVVIASLLPPTPPDYGRAGSEVTAPGTRQYWRLMTMAALAVTGAFTFFTYVTPFLTQVSAFPAAAVGPLLLVRGIAGVVGVAVGGYLVDHSARIAVLVPPAAQAVALLGLYVAGDIPYVAVALVALSGLSFAVLTTALAGQVLRFAPGRRDLAAAGASTAVNAGITAGAFIGSLLLTGLGVRGTALIGGLLSLAALAFVIGHADRRRPSAVQRMSMANNRAAAARSRESSAAAARSATSSAPAI
ncbi:MFS transporter [Streptosporangiaceae bacterium NEAU-GS5]|nr:MFS transporter [Streptosporangiaceae bacterium NEAU-GS5]